MAKGWLDNYGKEDNYNDSNVSAPEGFRGDGYSNVGRNYSPAWGGQFQMGGNVYPVNYVPQAAMGGSLPGVTGHMYARVGAPSNGKYAKKTLASAQNGMSAEKELIKHTTDYTDEYMKSPMYNEMLKNSTENEDEYKKMHKDRYVNFYTTQMNFPNKNYSGRDTLGESDSYTGDVNMFPSANFSRGVAVHEFSHSVDRPKPGASWEETSKERMIPKKDIELMQNYAKSSEIYKYLDKNKNKKSSGELKGWIDYLSEPTEVRARLNQIRHDAKEKNIYDPFKEKVTPEALKKIRKSKNFFGFDVSPYDDLREIYTEEQILDLLNTVSQNDSPSKNYNLAKNGGWLDSYEEGGVIKDDMGQWAHPGEITEINSNDITMQGVPYDVIGISDTGDTKLMKPGKNYKFKGKKVTEYPMAKNGVNQQDGKSLQQLDQLTNFTNYNTKQPGGWMDNLM